MIPELENFVIKYEEIKKEIDEIREENERLQKKIDEKRTKLVKKMSADCLELIETCERLELDTVELYMGIENFYLRFKVNTKEIEEVAKSPKPQIEEISVHPIANFSRQPYTTYDDAVSFISSYTRDMSKKDCALEEFDGLLIHWDYVYKNLQNDLLRLAKQEIEKRKVSAETKNRKLKELNADFNF